MVIRFHAFHGFPKSLKVDFEIILSNRIRLQPLSSAYKTHKIAVMNLLLRYGVRHSQEVLLSVKQTERFFMLYNKLRELLNSIPKLIIFPPF